MTHGMVSLNSTSICYQFTCCVCAVKNVSYAALTLLESCTLKLKHPCSEGVKVSQRASLSSVLARLKWFV